MLALTMLVCIVVTALTAWIYHRNGFVLLFYVCAVFGAISAHFVVMHVFAAVVFAVFNNKYKVGNFWFRPKRFEKRLYKFLCVRKWKSYLKAWDADAYSLELNDGHSVLMRLCHAEIVHEVIAIAGFLPMVISFYIPKTFWLFCVSSIIFCFIHIAFAVVQRYNRPRFLRIIEHRKRKDVG